jgi:hypothetical protein
VARLLFLAMVLPWGFVEFIDGGVQPVEGIAAEKPMQKHEFFAKSGDLWVFLIHPEPALVDQIADAFIW